MDTAVEDTTHTIILGPVLTQMDVIIVMEMDTTDTMGLSTED